MPYVVVQPNDTLAGLSKQNRVPLERLLAVNPQIQDPNRIFPGQIVILPLPHQRNPVSEVQRAVRPGDTMWNIAREFGVPLQQVIRLNPQVNNPDLIYPGMILTIKQGQACPRNVVDFVNRFMENKTGGH
ncbi:MAG: LysM peptidoglycan-binding domain-containing protein, partial [Bacillota bacterium]